MDAPAPISDIGCDLASVNLPFAIHLKPGLGPWPRVRDKLRDEQHRAWEEEGGAKKAKREEGLQAEGLEEHAAEEIGISGRRFSPTFIPPLTRPATHAGKLLLRPRLRNYSPVRATRNGVSQPVPATRSRLMMGSDGDGLSQRLWKK